jgi:acyl-CoA thioester hydrolase
VDIGNRVFKVGRSSITFEQALFQDGRITATAKTVVVQMNETTRQSEPLNDAAIERLDHQVPINHVRLLLLLCILCALA